MGEGVRRKAAPGAYDRIYAVVRRIPRGRVATYGQVAAEAGLAGRARQVGYALHALPTGSVVPWHRVINSAGRVSLPPNNGGLDQQLRLQAEGVEVFLGGRISLGRFQWKSATRSRGS
ncbi:MAG: MGMT family protein [Gemmatimonadales bacterium]